MLSDKELEAFVRDGFFSRKSLLSQDDCNRALEATWEVLAEQGITPDPATWTKAHSRRELPR